MYNGSFSYYNTIRGTSKLVNKAILTPDMPMTGLTRHIFFETVNRNVSPIVAQNA